jgi:nucleotide-binding universal stress UspA family protein
MPVIAIVGGGPGLGLEVPEAAHGAYLGLLGRRGPGRDAGPRVAELAVASAGEPLDAAARRLGRPRVQIERHGHPEREVVTAAADADLLILARDGDRSRFGPRSLGKATRCVVDHAPCPVLLVCQEPAPDIATIPRRPARQDTVRPTAPEPGTDPGPW